MNEILLNAYLDTEWRVGRHIGRTIYSVGPDSDGDTLIGVMDTPALATAAVDAHNRTLGSDPAEITSTQAFHEVTVGRVESVDPDFEAREHAYEADERRARWKQGQNVPQAEESDSEVVIIPGTQENTKRALQARKQGYDVSLSQETGEWTIKGSPR